MAGYGFKIAGQPCWLDFTDTFKPGDPPPSGYNDWHEWAKVQAKAGLKQIRCSRCSKWKFPQELTGLDSVCIQCAEKPKE